MPTQYQGIGPILLLNYIIIYIKMLILCKLDSSFPLVLWFINVFYCNDQIFYLCSMTCCKHVNMNFSCNIKN